MKDNGISPDRIAGDRIFTLGGSACTNPPYPAPSWAGSIILLKATDSKGHQTTTRLVLDVVAPLTGGGGNGGTIPSQLWQYIGYVQIRTGEVWVSNLSSPYNSPSTYQPYRVTRAQLNGNGGAPFPYKLGNTATPPSFIVGWGERFFKTPQSPTGPAASTAPPSATPIAAN